MKKLKTLERYFRDELEAGNIDHALRVSILSDGRVCFYVHPATASGDTQDFTVEYNSLVTHEGQPLANDTLQDSSEANGIIPTALLGDFKVENNCSHEWKLIARRPTMCPGELVLQDVKWCGCCGSLSIGTDRCDTHIYTPNATGEAALPAKGYA